jgi:hypothetical protein
MSFTCPWAGYTLHDYSKPVSNQKERRGIVFIQTNCNSGGAANRAAYVKELMNYLQIDSYGHCLNNAYVFSPYPSSANTFL